MGSKEKEDQGTHYACKMLLLSPFVSDVKFTYKFLHNKVQVIMYVIMH